MMVKILRTKREVVEALGGKAAVAELIGAKGPYVVQNYLLKDRHFSADTYCIMKEELELRGYAASPRLWGQIERRRDRAA